MLKTWIAALLAITACAPALATESLPMPIARYAALCEQSGGAFNTQLTSGIGIAYCAWSRHGRTECKVGADNVNVCGIACKSTACLKDNPARFTPTWPLQGGPNSAALPVQPGGATLAPAN